MHVTSLEVHPCLIRHIEYVMMLHGFEPKIIECDVFSQDFLDIQQKYDVVFCSHVLCHIMEPTDTWTWKNQFISRLKTKIAQGGCLISTAEVSEKQFLIDKFKFYESKSYELNQRGIQTVTVLKLWD